MEMDITFLDFLKSCSMKDKKAWNTFIDKYSSLIYLYINKTLKRYSTISQNGEADEIFNSVFLALLDNDCRRLKIFRGKNEYAFLAYLREISFHMTVDFLRNRRSFVHLDGIQNYFPKQDHSISLDQKDLKKIISILCGELPSRHYYLFRLIYEEELDSSEIAHIMGLNLNALNQLKFRMMKNIIKIAKEKGLYRELKKFLTYPTFSRFHAVPEMI